MSTTSTLITLAGLSAGGFTAAALIPAQAGGDALPLKDLINVGSAGLLLVALGVFLRFLSQERTENNAERAANREHVQKLVDRCAAATEKVSADFNDTATRLFTQVREDGQTARRELQELVKEIRKTQ